MVKNANPLFRAGPREAGGRDGVRAGRRRNTGVRAVLALGTVAAVLLLAACARDKAAAMLATATVTKKTIADHFPIKVGGKLVRMQLAVRPAEMQRGLMERRDLGVNDGMIFVYDKPQQMSFWMRNTPTALDIGFFNSQGVLEEVYPMYPFDETPVGSHSAQLQFALEMNQGWFRTNEVKPGAQLDLKALVAALKERGFEAKNFGLPDFKP